MAGGGLPDVFGALGGGLSSLAGSQPSGGGGAGGGFDPNAATPATAPNSVFTDPLVGAQAALTAGDPTGQGRQQPADQTPNPTFAKTQDQLPGGGTNWTSPANLGVAGGPPTQDPASPTAQDPNQALVSSIFPSSTGLSPQAEIATGYRQPAAATQKQGDGQGAIGASSINTDQQQQEQPGQQGQQKQQNPLQTAGRLLKSLAKQTPGGQPARGSAGFNPLQAISDLLTKGPAAFAQDLQGLTNQAGSAYQPQTFDSQGGARGYGYGAGAPAGNAQQAAPQPSQAPQAPLDREAQAAQAEQNVQGELATQEAQRNPAAAAQAGTAQAAQAGAAAVGAAPLSGPAAQTAQASAAAPGIGQNPAADRWVSPQHVSAHRNAGSDTPPTPGYSATMREVRAPVFEKLTPQDKILIAGMMQAENAKDPIGPMESLANRAAANHMTMGQLVRSHFYGPGTTFWHRGNAIVRNGQMPHYEAVMDAVRNGSNVLGGATDQGSGHDPNVGWSGGRILRSGEVYNDWGGGRGHAGNARWRKDVQARVQAENQQPIAQAITEPQRFTSSPYSKDFNDIYKTVSQLAPGGLPTQNWRHSANVERENTTPLAESGTPPANRADWMSGRQSPDRATLMAAQLGSNDIEPLLSQLARQWAQQTMGQ